MPVLLFISVPQGRVLAWGANESHQTNVPVGLSNVVAIAAGAAHSLALRKDGTMLAWGFYDNGNPVRMTAPSGLIDIVAIASGNAHAVALRSDGTVAVWGSNNAGQRSMPPGLSNVVAVAAGGYHSLALRSDGTVVAWPVAVPRLLDKVVAIAGGASHSLALRTDGTVVAWGSFYSSQGEIRSTVPLAVTNVVAIAAGGPGSLALRKDGTLVGWADNGLTDPVAAGLSNIVAIARCASHSLAMRTDGVVVAWGNNGSGQTNVPPGLGAVAALAAGGNHSLALGENSPPTAAPQTVSGSATGDLLITLAGSDSNLDMLRFQITGLPEAGRLFQYDNGTRGEAITLTQRTVADAGGRVFFAPALDIIGKLSTSFAFTVDDGEASSAPELVRVDLGAPYAATQAVTELTGTSATLNGMATANGVPASAWFEWGPTVAYGQRTSPLPAGDGKTVVRVSAKIDNLLAGEVYHSRLVVSNATGVVWGTDQQFTTFPTGKLVAWTTSNSIQTNLPPGLSKIVAIASGGAHHLALLDDSTVVAWGSNTSGQTNVPAGLSNVIAIAAGGLQSLALRQDGTVAGWGSYFTGNRAVPLTVPADLSNVVAIAAGDSHSLALRNDGSVVVWGGNYVGQTNMPAGLRDVVGIAAGGYHSLVLRRDGTVVAWGFNTQGQTNVPAGLSNVTAVAAGQFHSLALRTDGTVTAWATYSNDEVTLPVPVPAGLSNVLALAAGNTHTLALRKDGTVVAWSSVGAGIIDGPASLHQVTAIAAGGYQNLALGGNSLPVTTPQSISHAVGTDLLVRLNAADLNGDVLRFRLTAVPVTGALYQYANNGRGAAIVAANTLLSDPAGRLIFAPVSGGFGEGFATFAFTAEDGEDTSTPATVRIDLGLPLAATQDVTEITETRATLNGMATAHGLPATAWFEWGTTTAYGQSTTPVAVGAKDQVVRVSAALSNLLAFQVYHARLVVKNSARVTFGPDRPFITGGKVVAWGSSPEDDGHTSIQLPDGLGNVTAVAAGSYHSLALRTDGSVIGWEYNGQRQTNLPLSLSNIVAVAAGSSFSLALRKEGTVVAWGYNAQGQTNVPAGLTDVVAISAGEYHSLALRSDGTVVAWGYSVQGQTNVPPGLSNVVAIAAGPSHSLALRNDGTVIAWGYSGSGEMSVPAGLSHVVRIAPGPAHNVVVLDQGTVLAWGEPYSGQLSLPEGLTNIVALATGGSHSLALRTDGVVLPWGSNEFAQRSLPTSLTEVTSISAAANYSLALGRNSQPGALAQTASGPANSDLLITLSGSDVNKDLLTYRIAALPAAGALYQFDRGRRGAAILLSDTEVTDPSGRVIFAPPPNQYGEAYASFTYSAKDGQVQSAPALALLRIVGRPYATSRPATLVTKSSATLHGMATPNGLAATAWFEWGATRAYGLTTSPEALAAGPNVAEVSTGISNLLGGHVYHSRLVVRNEAGLTFGADQRLVTGGKVVVATADGSTSGVTTVPIEASNVVAVAAGGSYDLALTTDGKAIAWSGNDIGSPIVPVGLSNIAAVAVGGGHSLALHGNGTVTGWGSNDSGQIMALAGLTNIIAVAAGGSHSLALRRNGTVIAWGANGYGQTSAPLGLSNVVAVAAGQDHSLALRDDGTVIGWGSNFGWWGSPTGQATVPSGLSNVVAVAAAPLSSVALKNDGTVVAWGYNSYAHPVRIPAGSSNVVAVAAGILTVLLHDDGTTLASGQSYDYSSGAEIPVNAPSLGNVVAIAASGYENVALVSNVAPVATPQAVAGLVNTDLVVTLAGSDVDNDHLSFSIVALPDSGTLYQDQLGARGAAIITPQTVVSNLSGRVIFAPAPDAFGDPYASFSFVAMDGQALSDSATVMTRIFPPRPMAPVITGVAWDAAGGFALRFSGPINAVYRVWFSTDLIQWQLLGPAAETAPGEFRFSDALARDGSAVFYSLQL